MSRVLDKLDYQLRVNRVLLEAEYTSGVMGVMRDDDVLAMTVAYDRGVLAEDFARAILARDAKAVAA